MPARPTAPKRDREATEARIVDAAARVLARDGAAGFGINAVAAEAGADKKLIYRYFGDLDGLIAAMGARLDLWAGPSEPPKDGESYGARMARLLAAYGQHVRGDLLLQRLLAWELAEDAPALRALDAARAKAMQAAMPAMRGSDGPPDGVDAPAINAVLLAAANYLALRGRTMGRFAGLDLSSAAGRARADAALRFLAERAYALPSR
jgi:AcrR family transcriptional regulator